MRTVGRTTEEILVKLQAVCYLQRLLTFALSRFFYVDMTGQLSGGLECPTKVSVQCTVTGFSKE